MPPLAKYKYTRHTAKLDRILREASTKDRPRKVDITWLRSRYQINSSYEYMLSVLKFVNLIDADCIPTDSWDTIQYPTPENKIKFAALVRKAYAELFEHHSRAHRLDNETLKRFFLGQDIGGPVVQEGVLRTFKTLIKFGDFDADPNMIELPELIRSVETLNQNVNAWLKYHEELRARMRALAIFHSRLKQLSLESNESLTDAIVAAEAALFRSSHVLAWIGFTEVLYKPFTIYHIVTQDPNWRPKTVEELRRASDSSIVNSGERLGFYAEGTRKTLQGMVNDRNRCAHGAGYDPDLHETLAFLKKIFDMIEFLRVNHGDIWS